MFEQDMGEGQVDTTAEPVENTSTEPSVDQAAKTEAERILELDSLPKFKFEGKEWTPKDFRGAYMMQSDYSRKTMALAQERKYIDNLTYDLENVRKNPSLQGEFLKVYPKKFHSLLEAIGVKTQEGGKGNDLSSDPRYKSLEERLNRIEGDYTEKQVKAIEAEIDSIFKVMSSKYEYADEETVLARAQALLDKLKEDSEPGEQEQVTLSRDHWERIWKSVHDRNLKRAETYYSGRVGKQKQANAAGKDIGAGGGIPSQAPARPKTIREASKYALEELENMS